MKNNRPEDKLLFENVTENCVHVWVGVVVG